MSGLQPELKSKGFEVVEAAVNENANLPGFLSQFKPSFPVGTANALQALQYLQFPPDQRPLVPFIIFIDRKGMIRAQYTGADADFMNEQVQDQHIRAVAEKLLNEGASPAKAKSGTKSK